MIQPFRVSLRCSAVGSETDTHPPFVDRGSWVDMWESDKRVTGG